MEDSPTATVEDNDTLSVLAELRTLRGTLGGESKPLDLEVPGYKGLLLIRYKWVPYSQIAQNAKSLSKIEETAERQLSAAADVLVDTCEEFLIRVGEELQPLSKNDIPVTFGDPRLPESLGFMPTDTARKACMRVFNNDYALIRTADVVTTWLQDTSRKVDADVLGN